MQVTFTKADAKRYTVTIERENGPALVPRFAPGYDDLMPHDLAHYLVEEFFEIELGVWGQLAAGGGGIFTPAPEDNSLQYQRRSQRIGAIGRADMARSEQLVLVTVVTWEQQHRQDQEPGPPVRARRGCRRTPRGRGPDGRGRRSLAGTSVRRFAHLHLATPPDLRRLEVPAGPAYLQANADPGAALRRWEGRRHRGAVVGLPHG